MSMVEDKENHGYPKTGGIEEFDFESLDRETRREILDLLEEAYSESTLMINLSGGRTGKIIRTYQEMTLDLILDSKGWITATRSGSGEIAGIAFWLPPDVDYSTWKALSYMPVILKSFGLKCFLRALWLFILIEIASGKAKKKFEGKKSIYLANIAVGKKFQGRKFARKLLSSVLDYADENGFVVYLEADGLKNEGIYTHFGFDNLGRIGSCDYFSMLRLPR